MSEPHTIPAPEVEAAYQAILEGLSLTDLLEVPGALQAYRDDRKRQGVELTQVQALGELDLLTAKERLYVIWSNRPLGILLREHFADDAEAVASLVAGHAIVSVSRSQP